MRPNTLEALLARAVRTPSGRPTPCLLHPQRDRLGYARAKVQGQLLYLHRAAWEARYGPVPTGHSIDHLCRQRACVQLAHLEAVPHRTNVLRGTGTAAVNAAKDTCVRGHPLHGTDVRVTEQPNGHPTRVCRPCERERGAAYRARKAARAAQHPA